MLIKIKDGKYSCTPAMNVLQMTNIFLSTTFSVMQADLAKCPEEHRQELCDHFYDQFNLMASEFLARLNPDKELRPDLTAEAIIKAEEELLKEKESTMLNKEELKEVDEEIRNTVPLTSEKPVEAFEEEEVCEACKIGG